VVVTTRFAPTISGQLHIGGLYNALLNYLYAKKNNGLFMLRLDGLDLNPPHDVWQQNIPRDLELFGLHPDKIIKASDRLDYYKEVAINLDKTCDRSYHCNCTVQDTLKRAREDDRNFHHLYRPEKYPPYCKINGIIVRGPESDNNVASDCKVIASHEAKEHPAIHLTARGNNSGYYWEPVDVGYVHHPMSPEIEIDLGSEKDVCSVEIRWKDRPALHYEVSVWRKNQWCLVVSVWKGNSKYFVDYKPSQSFPPLTSDRNNFAITKTQKIRVKIYNCPKPVDKPYFYDYHCRDLGKKLDLYHCDTILRLKADPAISEYDVAYWYGRLPNLVIMSPLDDAELGVTHCIRGRDIEPWLALELQVAQVLKIPHREQLIHGLTIDNFGYKYSKWIESTPVRNYVKNNITPDVVLTYLANKAGIVSADCVLTLPEIIEQFNGIIPVQDIMINEERMFEELRG